jgi:hypothetical protein
MPGSIGVAGVGVVVALACGVVLVAEWVGVGRKMLFGWDCGWWGVGG